MKFKPILSVAHSCAAANLSAVALTPPNIGFILAVDLRHGDVHCLNPDRGKIAPLSPDRLPAQGMTFTDAHDVAPVCAPRRYGRLTRALPVRDLRFQT